MLAVVIGSGIVLLDSTVVNVALPAISKELPGHFVRGFEAQSFVYNGYLLALSALLILAGALSDFHGRRKVFLVGLVGFGFTSLLCGLAPNMESLIAFRVLQGAMGALLVPGSLSIIRASFDGESQGRAFGIWAGASGATTVLGPLIGGLLVDSVSWRAVFLMNVPLVMLGFYATQRYVSESHDELATSNFDWLGAFVIALAVGGLAFGAIRGQEHHWSDVAARVSLGIGTAAAIAFPFLMKHRANPLVPLELFRSRNFSVTNMSTFVIYGALYGTFYTQAIFVQGTLRYSAAAAGLSTMPAFLLLVFFSTRFGKLATRFGPRIFMTIGPAIMGAGVLWFSRIPASSAAWNLDTANLSSFIPPQSFMVDIFPAFMVFGIGLVMLVTPLTTALMNSLPGEHAGVASAVNNAISRVGPQLAGAIIFVAITASFYKGLAQRLPDIDTSSETVRRALPPLNAPRGVPENQVQAARVASTEAFRLSSLLSSGLLFAGAAINGLGIKNP
ncbi:MAG: MFS transporter [Actinomycetota bacterium]